MTVLEYKTQKLVHTEFEIITKQKKIGEMVATLVLASAFFSLFDDF